VKWHILCRQLSSNNNTSKSNQMIIYMALFMIECDTNDHDNDYIGIHEVSIRHMIKNLFLLYSKVNFYISITIEMTNI